MPTWTRAELCEWVKGKQLYARDGQAVNAPLPDWLLEASDGWAPGEDSAAAVERTHPDDRNILINTFIDALSVPGEIVSGQIRVHDTEPSADRWVTVDIEWINLLGDPEIGCLVCALLEVESLSLEAPLISETGAFENTRWMVLDVHPSGVIRSADGKVRETIGYEAEELVGRPLASFIHQDALADGLANWMGVVVSVGGTSTSRRPWNIKHGGHIWLESSYLNRGGDSILAVVWDITEKRRQEQELADITAQFRILADEVPAAVFRCDVDGTVLFHNARWAALIQDRPGVTRLHDLVADDDHGELSAMLAALATDEAGERRTIEVDSREGDAVWRVALRPTGDLGTGRGTVVGSIEDVTATVRLQTEVRHDALTGVLNRHGVDERLAEVAADDQTTLIVFIDLDGFKSVNDAFGHDAGDLVLTEVARRLSECVRLGDAVGRYGGDEFVLVCRDVAPGDDTRIVRRVEQVLAGAVAFEGGEWDVAASIGTARCGAGEDLASVLRRADHAMYEVKRDRKRALAVDAPD